MDKKLAGLLGSGGGFQKADDQRLAQSDRTRTAQVVMGHHHHHHHRRLGVAAHLDRIEKVAR
jgi:hypothetical protein